MLKKSSLYLKSNIKFEPSVCSWPAWPQIIQPVTAGLNLKNRYFNILESYLDAPDVHYSAANDPNLMGGPFINIPPEESSLVASLFADSKEKTSSLVGLAEDVKVLNNLLLEKAKGHGLEPLYQEIPKSLSGMIELSYDLNNFPRARMIEPLIYKNYYDSSFQSVFVSTMKEDFRPFVLSTPYIPTKDSFEIKLPFNSPFYDKLFESKTNPISRDLIAEIFNTNDIEKVVNNFFQENRPLTKEESDWNETAVRVRYFGHACVLIETKNCSVLVDPLISYDNSSSIDRYTYLDLPNKIDYVLFTHSHEDHIVFESILQLRHKVKTFVLPRDSQGNVADPSIRLILSHTGFNSLISLEEFQTIVTEDCEIIGLPFLGEHCDVDVASKLGYCVVANGIKMLFLADSNNLEPMLYEHIFKEIGDIDIVFIGMEHEGGPLTFQYGGLITIPIERSADQSRRLSGSDYQKAMDIIKQSKCKNAYVYAMGQEPWLNHLMALNYNEESPQLVHAKKFVKECQTMGIQSELLFGKREWIFD